MVNNNLINISIKVQPNFKELIESEAKKGDTLGIGNVSEFIRKCIQEHIFKTADRSTDVEFLYNLLSNKFKLKAELTNLEKQSLKKIEDDLDG